MGTALGDIANEMVDAIAKARLILAGDRERGAWEGFMAGYIAYHRLSSRYRLHEVFGSDAP